MRKLAYLLFPAALFLVLSGINVSQPVEAGETIPTNTPVPWGTVAPRVFAPAIMVPADTPTPLPTDTPQPTNTPVPPTHCGGRSPNIGGNWQSNITFTWWTPTNPDPAMKYGLEVVTDGVTRITNFAASSIPTSYLKINDCVYAFAYTGYVLKELDAEGLAYNFEAVNDEGITIHGWSDSFRK